MFTLEALSYTYPTTAGLADINCTIDSGECVALMGPNGSGKSTLFKILTGLLEPSSGRFLYRGQTPDFGRLRQEVGLVFQNSSVQLFTDSVQEELAFGPQQLGLEPAIVAQRVEDVMGLLGIERLRDRVPYQLSGGEQKLVALGCVLTMNPQTILLDEPFGGLSTRYRQQLLNLLAALKAAGKTIVLSSHNYPQIAELVDRVLALDETHHLVLDTAQQTLTAAQCEQLVQL